MTLLHLAGVFNCVVCSSDAETATNWLKENRGENTEWKLVLQSGKCPHSNRTHYLFSRDRE